MKRYAQKREASKRSKQSFIYSIKTLTRDIITNEKNHHGGGGVGRRDDDERGRR